MFCVKGWPTSGLFSVSDFKLKRKPTISGGFHKPIGESCTQITGLTGHYSNGNGPYKMSTNFKNDNVVYFNENKWAIWYDSDKNEWVLTIRSSHIRTTVE